MAFEHVAQYRDVYFALVGTYAGTVLIDAVRDVFAGFADDIVSQPRGSAHRAPRCGNVHRRDDMVGRSPAEPSRPGRSIPCSSAS